MDSPAFNVLSLCSGHGGLDLAVKLAVPDARTVVYVESEVAACEVLVARMREGRLDDAPVWTDLRTFDGDPWRGSVDCVVAGFPCQDISTAGKGAGIKEGTRSGLFFHVVRVVRQVRPRYVFLENVSAILVRGLDVVLGALAEAGYDAEWLCLKASEVGAPHRRERFFLLAHAADGRDGFGRASTQQGSDEPKNGVPRPNGAAVDRLDAGECDVADAGRERVPGRDGMHLGGVGRAAAQVEGQREDAQRQRLRDAPEHGGEPVVDGEVFGGQPDAPEQGAVGRTAADGAGAAVDDSIGDGPQGQHCPRPAPGAAERADGVPYWPPGPGDRDGWGRILALCPGLAPAVESAFCRVASRTAGELDISRVDRLRGLGNLVVPLQGAVALTLLMRRFS